MHPRLDYPRRLLLALLPVLACASASLPAAEPAALQEEVRPLARYLGAWDVAWTEDGAAQQGELVVRPAAGGSVLQSVFTQRVRGRVVWSSVSFYFRRPDLGRLGTLSLDSTGRRDESVQIRGGDHELWQGAGSYDPDGKLETALAHTDWNGPDEFRWHATHVRRQGAAAEDTPVETYRRRRESTSTATPAAADALVGPVRRLADLLGGWSSGTARWRVSSAAGGRVLLSERSDGLDVIYFATETRRIERLAFESGGGQVLWVLAPSRAGADRVWQRTVCRLPGGGWQSGVEVWHREGVNALSVQTADRVDSGVPRVPEPARRWTRLAP